MRAAGRFGLTGLYDLIVALTMRERAFRAALVRAVLDDAPVVNVLDVGCGTGTFAVALAQDAPSGTVLGVDGDPRVLARAREKAARAHVDVRFVLGLADALPVEDQSMDAVTLSLVLHHLAPGGKRRALLECLRVLRPGGRLLVVDWGRPKGFLPRAGFGALRMLDGVENTRDHAEGRIPNLIERAGFEAIALLQRWPTMWGHLELLTASQVR